MSVARDVKHTILDANVNPNLHHSWSNNSHRFPVAGLKALLNPPQLKPRILARAIWKVPNAAEAVAVPDDLCRRPIHIRIIQ